MAVTRLSPFPEAGCGRHAIGGQPKAAPLRVKLQRLCRHGVAYSPVPGGAAV